MAEEKEQDVVNLGKDIELESGMVIKKECPKCGSELIVRKNNASGDFFLGCSDFPKCRYTAEINTPSEGQKELI